MHQQSPRVSQQPNHPPGHNRNDGCTHYQMTRLFDPDRAYFCDLCHGQPNIGWLYRCTQATDGALPLSDFTYATIARSRQLLDLEDDRSYFEYPADDGHHDMYMYTFEEADDELADALEKSTISEMTPADESADRSDMQTTYSTLPTSPSMSTRSSTPMTTDSHPSHDVDVQDTPLQQELADKIPQRRTGIDINRDSQCATVPKPNTPCTFKVCPACRPVFRERSYQSIDKILHDPMAHVPAWEFYNRPISNARVVAQLGLRRPQNSTKCRQMLRVASHVTGLSDLAKADQSHATSSEDISDAVKHSIRRRSVFRDTVQTALRRARNEEANTRAPWTLKEFRAVADKSADEQDDSGMILPAIAYTPRRPLPPLPSREQDDPECQKQIQS